METLIKFSKLLNKEEKLNPEESEEFVSLWNYLFGVKVGAKISNPADIYKYCQS